MKKELSDFEKGFDSGLRLGLNRSISHAKEMLKTWDDLLKKEK